MFAPLVDCSPLHLQHPRQEERGGGGFVTCCRSMTLGRLRWLKKSSLLGYLWSCVLYSTKYRARCDVVTTDWDTFFRYPSYMTGLISSTTSVHDPVPMDVKLEVEDTRDMPVDSSTPALRALKRGCFWQGPPLNRSRWAACGRPWGCDGQRGGPGCHGQCNGRQAG